MVVSPHFGGWARVFEKSQHRCHDGVQTRDLTRSTMPTQRRLLRSVSLQVSDETLTRFRVIVDCAHIDWYFEMMKQLQLLLSQLKQRLRMSTSSQSAETEVKADGKESHLCLRVPPNHCKFRLAKWGRTMNCCMCDRQVFSETSAIQIA